MGKVIEQLNDLQRVKPNEDWVKRNRDLLMSQITSQAPETQSSFVNSLYFMKMFMPTRFVNFVAKPVGIFVLVFSIILGSGAMTVSASKSSLPGNILYPVKLTSEQVKVSLTVSDDKKAELQMNHAEERVKEIEMILSSEDNAETKNEKVSVASNSLKKSIQEVKDNLDKVKDQKVEKEKVEKSIAIVKEVDKKVEEISLKLKEKKAESHGEMIAKIINETQEAVDEVGVKTVEFIVDKYDKGEIELTAEEVVETVAKKIKVIEDKIAEVKEKEAVVTDQQNLIDDTDTTDVIEEEVTETTETLEEAVDQEKEVNSVEAEGVLAEAVSLLNSGDISAALEKVKESTEITKQFSDNVDAKANDMIAPVIEESNDTSEDASIEVSEDLSTEASAEEDNSIVE